MGRQSLEDCQRMAAIFAQRHADVREAGPLYAAWRKGSRAVRRRLLKEPELFFKTQRQERDPSTAELLRDLEMVAAIMNRVQRRLAGAGATELDARQCAGARRQIDRIEKQLQRIGARLGPEPEPRVEPSPTHHDSGAECAASEQTRDRAGDGDLAGGRPEPKW